MIKVEKDQRVFFVGDIHGNFNNLKKAIKKNNIQEEDCLIFLGDLINKGKQNIEVLNFVKNWKNKAILIGNHERIFIDFILHEQQQYLDFLMSCGGKWIIDVDRKELEEWATYLKENCFYFLEFEIEKKVIGCCHASVPFEDWNKMKQHFNDVHTNIIWSFDRFNLYQETKRAKKIKNIDGVIFGHVPVSKITKIKNSLYIDTGSFFKDYKSFILGDISMLEIRDAKKMLSI